ncbi:MAG: VWA domain-containing protein, partial [bacterium]
MFGRISAVLLLSVMLIFPVAFGCGGGGGGEKATGTLEGTVYVPATHDGAAFRAGQAAPNGYVPMVGATVQVTVGGKTVTGTTDALGFFKVAGVPPGEATVQIVPPTGSGYSALTMTVNVAATGVTSLGQGGNISLLSEDATELRLVLNLIDVSAWPQVKVYLQVLDNDLDIPVLGLGPRAFVVTVNGSTVAPNVQQASATNFGTSIGLVLDRSGSMAGKPFTDLQVAAKAFVSHLQSNDEAEIISLASSVVLNQEFTNDIALLQSVIDALNSGGSTALYDAIALGVENTAARTNQLKAVVAMTDGQENNSVTYSNRDNLIDYIDDYNVPVYTIGLGSVDAASLQQIATDTGGEYFYAPDSAQLADLYNKISIRTEQQYILTITVPDPTAANIDVDLTVNHGGLSGNVSGGASKPYDDKGLKITPGNLAILKGFENDPDAYVYANDGKGKLLLWTSGHNLIVYKTPEANYQRQSPGYPYIQHAQNNLYWG